MTTIVTAYYPLPSSKHGMRKYLEWMRNFCQIPRPMVLFTDAKTAPLLERLRADYPAITRVITKEFDTYALTTPERMNFWRRQLYQDPEAAIHNPDLYAVWAIKQECVSLAIAENPFGHDWYIWCDIGIQRNSAAQTYYTTFGDKVPELCLPGHIHFLEVHRIPDSFAERRGQIPMPYPPPAITLGGGCIVGDRVAWRKFSEEYVRMLTSFTERGWFAGKDQIVYFAMLMENIMPFRLFSAIRFGTPPTGDYWMSFPVILGGQAPAIVDTRFKSPTAS